MKFLSPDKDIRDLVEDVKLVVSVADKGGGIPKELQERVIEKLNHAGVASAVDGIGLGLSIYKISSEAHGGSIGVANLPEGGTRVAFIPTLGK